MRTEVTIGIDIGGTNSVVGIIDRDGKCYAEITTPTWAHPHISDFIHHLHLYISQKLETLNVFPIAIGIGAPNGNYHKGIIEDAANLPWKGVIPLVELFQKEFHIPTFLTNDAKAAAIGEMVFGRAKGMKNFVVITLGTGLGCGIVINGQLLYGDDGLAGELGHTIVHPNGRACNCGLRGCLETYVSAPGIKRTFFELLATETEKSLLRNYSYDQLDAKLLFEAAQQNDPIAAKAFQQTGKELGRALANIVALIRPEAIFLLGGLAKAGKWIFNSTIEQMEQDLLPIFRNKVQILPSALPNNTAIWGASAFAWHELQFHSQKKI